MISVLIATRNRCAQLEHCLQNLARMETPGLAWEIVVVDNGSTDETEDVVKRFAAESRLVVRYVLERHSGKSFALNAGLRKARGSIIAFTDDDCIVHERWLGTIADEFQRDPALMVLGGRVELYDARDQPISLVRYMNRLQISRIDLSALVGRVIGANMAIRWDVVERIGGFDVALGPGVGKTPFGGEDLEFVYRACFAQLKVAYTPDCLVYHNHGRRTEAAMKAVVRTYNRGIGAFYSKYFMARDLAVVKLAYWTVKTQLLKISSLKIGRSERRWRLVSLRDLLAGICSGPLDHGRMVWNTQECCGLCPAGIVAADAAPRCPRSQRLRLLVSPASVPR